MSETRTAPVAPVARRRRWPLVLVRVCSVTVLVQVLIQAALAGGFITGDVTMLDLHSANALLLTGTTLILLPCTVLLFRPGRGPWWPMPFALVMIVLVTVQLGYGYARLVGLHIPLGVAIMGLISGFTWWAWARRVPR